MVKVISWKMVSNVTNWNWSDKVHYNPWVSDKVEVLFNQFIQMWHMVFNYPLSLMKPES